MKSSKDHSETSQAALLRSARKLFAEKGFAATSIREICEDAGVNLSLVSYHFDGKDGIYEAIIEPYGKAKLHAAEQVLSLSESQRKTVTPEEFRVRILMFCEQMVLAYLHDPEVSQIVHRESDLGMKITEKLFRKTFLRTFELLEEFCRAAETSKILRPGTDPVVLARVIFSITNTLIRYEKTHEKIMGISLKDLDVRREYFEKSFQILEMGALQK